VFLSVGKKVQHVQPSTLLDAAEGIADVSGRLFDACISEEIPVYVRIPQHFVAVTLGVAGHTGVWSDVSGDELGDGSRILVDYSSDGEAVVDHRMEFVRVDVSDLERLRDGLTVEQGEFWSGGLLRRGGASFELVDFDNCRTARRGSLWDTDFGLSHAAVTIKVSEVFVDLEDVPRVRASLLAEIEIEDRWGHREAAPAVHLIYRAAQYFADKKYSFRAAKEWIRENDVKGLLEGREKALDYAARLINRNPRKKSAESREVLRIDKITNNEMGKDYRESIASNRLSLLHLATDCWIHDKKHPQNSRLPKGGLPEYLRGLGFTIPDDTGVVKGKERNPRAQDDHVVNPMECQVEYLRLIIEIRS